MTIQNSATLKGYFNVNDKPTESQFSDLVDSTPDTSSNTIAALKALTAPTVLKVALVRGYSSAGDGGGGLFFYDTTSTDADDGGLTIIPDSAPATGRWKRLTFGTELQARWFGVLADGTTDDAAALDRAFAKTGRRIRLPSGTMLIKSNLAEPTCGGIVGDGWVDSIIQADTGVTKVLSLAATAATNLRYLGHFTILGNATASARGVVYGDGALFSGLLAENLNIADFTGSSAIGAYYRDIVGAKFDKCRVKGCTTNERFETDAVSGTPTTLTFNDGWSREATGVGSEVITGASIRFRGRTFESNTNEGLKVVPGASQTAIDIITDHCWFEGNWGSSTGQYQYVVDGSAAGCTARVKDEGSYYNGSASTAKSIQFTGTNVRAGIASPTMSSVANFIQVAASAQLVIHEWSNNVTFDTVMDISGGLVSGYINTGIRFPATQSASSNVNTLDDYEEGTFTPTIILGGGSVTYTTQTGIYTKIGRLVICRIQIVVNVATTPSGTLELGGLPFTASSSQAGSVAIHGSSLAATAVDTLVGQVTASSTRVRVFRYSAGAVANPGGDIQNGSVLNATAIFEV